jgi:hypothetical protein
MTVRVPNFPDPQLTQFLAAFVKDQDDQNKDILSSATANHSVLLQSPNNVIYEITVDDSGHLTSTLVQGSASSLGMAVTEPPDIAHFTGTAGIGDAPVDGFDYGRKNSTWDKVMPLAGGATTTGGFAVTSVNLGTGSGTVTLNPLLGNYQYITNNGAFTLANPSPDCAIDLMVINGASAGTITFTGFAVAAGNFGDPLTTANGSRFIISIRRIASFATYTIKALQ